jgi:transcriptional regulator NrdR family protein
MTSSRTCPACGNTHAQVALSHRRSYGLYRRLECCACGHRWTDREAKIGKPPAPRQQCPECGSTNTAVIESRVTPYSRRQRVLCRGCSHRWTNVIDDPQKARVHARRDAGALTEDEVRLILTSTRSVRDIAAELRVSRGTVLGVRRGDLHPQVAPELPRLPAQPRRRSCTSCRFWEPDAVRPCKEGWPDPETDGPGYANECDDYSPKRDGLLRTAADGGLRRG